MSETKRIKKTAPVLLIIVGAVILLFAIQLVRAIVFNIEGSGWNAFTVVSHIIGIIFVLALLGIGANLLYSIRKDATPFDKKNVIKLKAIAILLIVYEPYYYLAEYLMNRFRPIILSDGSLITLSSPLNGVIFVTGLVMYCVALIFQYGISLQNQVDETL